jgi:hypothetical protein
VSFWDEEAVAGEQRAVVEECQGAVVLENDGGRVGTRGDTAKLAVVGHVPIMPVSPVV